MKLLTILLSKILEAAFVELFKAVAKWLRDERLKDDMDKAKDKIDGALDEPDHLKRNKKIEDNWGTFAN